MSTTPKRAPESRRPSRWRLATQRSARPAWRSPRRCRPKTARCSRCPTRARPSGTSRTSPGSSRPSCSSASSPASSPSIRPSASSSTATTRASASSIRAPAARPDHAADAGRRASATAPMSTSACRRCSPRAPDDAEIAALVDARPAARAAAPGAAPHRHQARAGVNPLAPGLRQALADDAGAAAAAALVRLRRRPGRARPRRRRSTAPSASTTRRRATARSPRRSSSRRGPATYGDFLAFIDDDGYRAARALALDGLGLGARSGGAARRSTGGATATAGSATRCRALVEIDPHTPVCHLSYFEADAFARWAGARLPTELEWEHRGTRAARAVARQLRRPRRLPSAAADGAGRRRAGADVRRRLGVDAVGLPAPTRGYRPLPGAVGEYNGKFMCNQFVLRGGSCATPAGHVRASYRNFFPPDAQWQFSGVRLARATPDRRRRVSSRACRQAADARRVDAESRPAPNAASTKHAAGDRDVLHEVDLLGHAASAASAAQKLWKMIRGERA